QVLDFLFGCRVPPPAGHVDGDVLTHDLSEQRSHRLARDSPQHIQNRELHPRLRAPQPQSIQLVVVLPAVKLPQQFFQVASVLTDKKRDHHLLENLVQILLARRVGQRNAFRPILDRTWTKYSSPFFSSLIDSMITGAFSLSNLNTGAAAALSNS